MNENSRNEDVAKIFEKAIARGDHLVWEKKAQRLLSLTNNFIECSLTPRDIVSEVISRTLEGTRKYKFDLELEQYVTMTMKSIINGEMKKNRRMIYDKTGTNGIDFDDTNAIWDEGENIDTRLFDSDVEFNDILEIFEEACKDDDDAFLVLLEMKKGNHKNEDIQNELGLEPHELIVIKKRIRRRVDKKLLKS